jgi:hypothetical protein
MCQLGFADKWVSLIMSCASTVSYSILVNGKPAGHITPTRGIRQGDPLSPYLFLLVAEGLSSLLTRAVENGSISGVPTSASGLKLSHLFFADDSLLFCQTNFQECCNLMQVMTVYEQASEQKLNTGKTSIFFSKNTGGAFRRFITNSVGISTIKGHENILVCLLWWGDQKPLLLLVLWVEYRRSLMIGRRDSSLKRRRRS